LELELSSFMILAPKLGRAKDDEMLG
jgi:hypothetical protein